MGGDVLITGWKRGSGRERKGWAADLAESTHSSLCPASQSTLCWKATVTLCLAIHCPIRASIHSAHFCFACSGIMTGPVVSGLQNRHSSCPCGVYSPSGRKAFSKWSHTHLGAWVHAQSLLVSASLQLYRLQPARLLGPWDFTRQECWSGCHFLLQGIVPTQGLNPSLPCLSHQHADSLLFELPGKPIGKKSINQMVTQVQLSIPI